VTVHRLVVGGWPDWPRLTVTAWWPAEHAEFLLCCNTRRPGRWGSGDLTGLRMVRASGGCLHDIW